MWLFTTRLDVPATNNGSESAIRGFKLTAKVQGCWRTLQRHCRIRQVRRSLRPWQDHDCVRRLDDRLYGWETSLSAMSR